MALQKMEKILIKEISSEEAKTLCRTLVEALPHFFGDNPHDSVYDALDQCRSLAAFINPSELAEANQGGEKIFSQTSVVKPPLRPLLTPVGLLSFYTPYPPQAHILWMGVHPKVQGCGIGTQLLSSLAATIQKEGGCLLSTEMLSPDSAPAYGKTLGFYQSQGFLPVMDVVPTDHPYPLVVLVKPLFSPHPQEKLFLPS